MRGVLAIIGCIFLGSCVSSHMVERISGSVLGFADPALDETDLQLAFNAAENALKSGIITEWENPANGHRGRFSPGVESRDGDKRMCREFSHRIWSEGSPYDIDGLACRYPGEDWQVQ